MRKNLIFLFLLFQIGFLFSVTKPVYGIDVSHHQGEIDWTKVRTWKNHKISFVYIKGTEGATHVDKNYSRNFNATCKNGLTVGSYHYFRTTSGPREQFANFKKHVDKNKQDLIPLIDVEEIKNWDADTFHKNFQLFLNLVEKHYGEKPMIYTVNSFYNKHLAYKYTTYKFMIGRYGENKLFMKDKHKWTVWQFSESETVEGIPKKVDVNILNVRFTLKDIVKK